MADIRFALRSPGQIPAAAPPPFGGAGRSPATGDLLLCQPAALQSRPTAVGIATSSEECW